jgi:iron complex transport system substrate-binding protein
MNKWLWLFLTILCLAGGGFLIIAMLSDQTSNTITQPTRANRIVSLAPNLTEILFELGLCEKVVAVSNDSDYPAEAAKKNKVGTFWQPNTEAIIAAKPDLVVTLWFEQQKSVAEALRRLGYSVLILKIESIEELLAAIKDIGTATGTQDRADQLIEDITNRLNDLQSKVASTEKVKVLWSIQAEPLRVAGRNTFLNELIELAGGENAIGSTIQQYPPLGGEQLLSCEAQIIIQSAMSTADIQAQQQSAKKFWSRWPMLPAVKNERIYVVNPNTTLRLGPRLCEGLELIVHCLHPDIYQREEKTVRSIR